MLLHIEKMWKSTIFKDIFCIQTKILIKKKND